MLFDVKLITYHFNLKETTKLVYFIFIASSVLKQ